MHQVFYQSSYPLVQNIVQHCSGYVQHNADKYQLHTISLILVAYPLIHSIDKSRSLPTHILVPLLMQIATTLLADDHAALDVFGACDQCHYLHPYHGHLTSHK